MPTLGYRELNRKLNAMGRAPAGKALRSAAMTAMLPALRTAQAFAPHADPPYGPYEGISKSTGRPWKSGVKDPYPVRTYKGRLRTPGFASRNVARKSRISRDKTQVTVMLGVKPEAFYAVSFSELGTSRTPPKPWLEPAFRQSIPQVDARFRHQLKARIDKAARTR